ncbi:alginate export family protein [Niveispirillum fermenti]|uniref:alginate export family protein n=1 Tax=Niveispirillum fermenti TaxID=1233113 RepID=UPI004043818A
MRRRAAGLLTALLLAVPSMAADDAVTAGLDLRLRWESLDHGDWADGGDARLLHRAMPWLDVSAQPLHVRLRGIAAGVEGMRDRPGPPDRTGLDLLEAAVGIDLAQGGDIDLMLTVGRALLGLGSERLVGRRYGANVPQPFDGARMRVAGGGWQVDLLALRPVIAGSGDLDDAPGQGRFLRGAYATIDAGQGTLDAYLLATGQDTARYAQGAGRESRRTAGLRLAGSDGNWTWNGEGMWQWGRFAGTEIRAWSLASEVGYRLPGPGLSPRLLLRANIASGDASPADGRLGTFNPLYPRAKYFGELTPIGPRNMVNLHPGLELDLGAGFQLSAAGVFYWRQRRADGLYGLSGQVLRPAEPDAGRFVGRQGELVLGWEGRGLTAAASFSLFRPGQFVRGTGPARTITLVGLELGWSL